MPQRRAGASGGGLASSSVGCKHLSGMENFAADGRPTEPPEASSTGALLRRLVATLLFAAALYGWGCGDSCVGYSSFTDSNGLIVIVGCDGTSFVVTPTPGTTSPRVP